MTTEKKCYRLWRSQLPKQIKYLPIAVVLIAGVVLLGCNVSNSGEKAGKLMPSTKSNMSIAPDLGLKKVHISKVKRPKQMHSNEMASILLVQCLFNQSNVDSEALNRCMDADRSEGVFSAKVKSTGSDKAGNQHLRTTQWYRGLRVMGAEIIVHIKSSGEIYRINGAFLPHLNIAIRPAIEKNAALAIGMKRHEGGLAVKVEQAPVLVIYAKRLAYHYIISNQGPGTGVWHYFIDANSGDTIFRYDNLQTR